MSRTSSSRASRRSAWRRSSSDSRPRRSASGNSRRSALSCRSSSRNSAREVKSRYGSSTPRCTRSSTSTPMKACVRSTARPAHCPAPARRVESRQRTLARRLLVPGRAVHLAGQEQPGHCPRLERRCELGRREIVVLDRVAWPSHPHSLPVPAPSCRKASCTAGGQRRGEPVHVHLGCVEPLGLEEDLVAYAPRGT